jgi:hypothetical protein
MWGQIGLISRSAGLFGLSVLLSVVAFVNEVWHDQGRVDQRLVRCLEKGSCIMKTRMLLAMFCALLVAGFAAVGAQAQDGILVTNLHGVEVWSFPQPSPGEGLLATKLVLQHQDPNQKLVTFSGLSITGALHQVFIQGRTLDPTPTVDSFLPSDPAEVVNADSHLLIVGDNVGGGAGQGFTGIDEANDLSDPTGISDAVFKAGVGNLFSNMPTDAFFLDTPYQANSVELAYLVAPVTAAQADPLVYLNLRVLGTFPDDPPVSWSGTDLAIPFTPEPTGLALAAFGLLGLAGLRRR